MNSEVWCWTPPSTSITLTLGNGSRLCLKWGLRMACAWERRIHWGKQAKRPFSCRRHNSHAWHTRPLLKLLLWPHAWSTHPSTQLQVPHIEPHPSVSLLAGGTLYWKCPHAILGGKGVALAREGEMYWGSYLHLPHHLHHCDHHICSMQVLVKHLPLSY